MTQVCVCGWGGGRGGLGNTLGEIVFCLYKLHRQRAVIANCHFQEILSLFLALLKTKAKKPRKVNVHIFVGRLKPCDRPADRSSGEICYTRIIFRLDDMYVTYVKHRLYHV